MTATRPAKNGVARLISETGLTPGKLEKLCYVKYPEAPAGRETIRRYARGERAEQDWNEEVILAMALATNRTVDSISPVAAERLAAKHRRYLEYAPWDLNPEPSGIGHKELQVA